MITKLDATSRVLSDHYDEAVSCFMETPYSEIENKLEAALNVAPNDWREIEARLRARRVLVAPPQPILPSEVQRVVTE
jgi:hypothetical protein